MTSPSTTDRVQPRAVRLLLPLPLLVALAVITAALVTAPAAKVGVDRRAVGGVGAAIGCGDGEPECRDHIVPAGTDLTTPEVSFSRDVMPTFVNSCAFTTCHGNPTGLNNGVFLGRKPESSRSDVERVLAATVRVPAPQLSTMSFVAPGDPENSYLMRKLDGDHCLLHAQCKDGSCGISMPRQSGLLPLARRDAIRRWIAQGAKDN
jgi:hypothetical protein